MDFFEFTMYGIPEDGSERFVVIDGQVSAEDEQEAKDKAMGYWDDRLDTSGCTPSVEVDEIDLSNWEEFEHLEINGWYMWLDPDEGSCSQKVLVTGVDSETVFCRNTYGAEIQCYPDELVPIKKD